jgi:uncharacterized 2Fe-2S/4Fe-4S cluster protein (DUF4445 family)
MTHHHDRWIKHISLHPPRIGDNIADTDRLLNALKADLSTRHIEVELDLVRQLPDHLRKNGYRLKCLLFKDEDRWHLVSVTSPDTEHAFLGLAVDLGTSRIVLRLVDLASGDTIGESSFDNPQISIGPDVLTRIHYAETENGRHRLHELVMAGINLEIEKLCKTHNKRPRHIRLLAVAGNTSMSHLFMNLDPRWIIREPYIPVANRFGIVNARQLGLKVCRFAKIYVFPNIGSYFGGDLIAGILYTDIHRRPETSLLVDVGTNAEVVLGNENWLIACAGAAGPALEGGMSRMGMMAGPGVIDRLSIDASTGAFHIHTIGDRPPKGICGSGVIDLAAQLFLAGMIDIRGKLVPAVCKDRLKDMNGMKHLVVIPAEKSSSGADLSISQADLDSLIRSKAAMFTILETITQSVGYPLNEVFSFFVAGTFGSYINPESAVTIGMLPDLPRKSYIPLGNTSLGGATMALTSIKKMSDIEEIRNRITYLELNVNQSFMNRFSAAKFIPHTNTDLFPSIHAPSPNPPHE